MRYLTVPGAPPPPPSAKYSHAVEAGGLLFVTGQLPIDPKSPANPPPEGIDAQTKLVFEILRTICSASGYRLEDAAFVRIYLTNFARDYTAMNAVYSGIFSDDARLPGRTTVGVTTLGRDSLVEIDLVVGKP
ncbi:reactive intermediate/imine deaminase [Terrihabitans soli]|uniref:Reactive intermediate/imine deaminase n=1 Tax=Terrihabitans soli TaxID=708113 RepID=A0A6S6QRW7_9HYPH|nr:RidA family protein [Terrihabitans soli]BCJ89630.1 reactive intermediate/imine deaminase [Terrihabitans soli]